MINYHAEKADCIEHGIKSYINGWQNLYSGKVWGN